MRVAAIALSSVATILGLALSGPAHALNPDCVWRAVPPAIRQELQAAGPDQPNADAVRKLSDAEAEGMAKACGFPADSKHFKEVGYVLEARALQIWATAQLGSRYGVSADALAGIWDALPADFSDKMVASAAAMRSGSPVQYPDGDPVFTVAAKLGVNDEDGVKVLMTYVAATALLKSSPAQE